MMNKYGIRLWRRRRYLDRLRVLSVPYSFLSKIQPYSRILDPANLRTYARVRHVWRRCNGFINFATWSCEPNRSTAKPRGPLRFGRGCEDWDFSDTDTTLSPYLWIYQEETIFLLFLSFIFSCSSFFAVFDFIFTRKFPLLLSLFFSLGFFLFILPYPLSDYLFRFPLFLLNSPLCFVLILPLPLLLSPVYPLSVPLILFSLSNFLFFFLFPLCLPPPSTFFYHILLL